MTRSRSVRSFILDFLFLIRMNPWSAWRIYFVRSLAGIRLMLEICVAEVRKLAERSVSASLPQLMQSGVNHAADKREWKPCFDARGVPQPSV
jgi:hypothetical protein